MLPKFFQSEYLNNQVVDYLIALGILVGGIFTIIILQAFILRRLKRWSRGTATSLDDALLRIFESNLVPVIYLGTFYLAMANLTLHPILKQTIDVLALTIVTILGIRFFVSFLKAQAAELEDKVKQNSFTPPPPSQIISLQNAIDSLPNPRSHRAAVRSKLAEAIAQWQEHEGAPNSLVVLGSPIEPLGKLVNEILAEWEQQHLWLIKSLSHSARPPNYSTIKSQLLEEIDRPQDVIPAQGNHESRKLAAAPSGERQVLMVIPDLSWCFLRCVDGLEEIEYLQDWLLNNRSQFWLIGCNHWAWQYLDAVCRLGSYFENTLSLPALQDFELKEWLTPVSETIQFDFGNGRDNQNNNLDVDDDNDEHWSSPSEQNYFEPLAKTSLGLSTVAARLWLLSLGIQEQEDKSANSDASEAEDNPSPTLSLERTNLTLPNLPELTKDDRYLLFSLCLHGGLNLPELALSLGERQSRVRDQVQVLWRAGILACKKGLFEVNSVHYPRLRRDLVNNHFLIGGDN